MHLRSYHYVRLSNSVLVWLSLILYLEVYILITIIRLIKPVRFVIFKTFVNRRTLTLEIKCGASQFVPPKLLLKCGPR